jgi:hypothetical protein
MRDDASMIRLQQDIFLYPVIVTVRTVPLVQHLQPAPPVILTWPPVIENGLQEINVGCTVAVSMHAAAVPVHPPSMKSEPLIHSTSKKKSSLPIPAKSQMRAALASYAHFPACGPVVVYVRVSVAPSR